MATVALIVSIGAGLAAIVALVLQFRESSRRDEEIGLLRDEAKRRDEEIALLRRQVEAKQEAHISPFGGVQGSASEQGIEYTVGLQNTGPSAASQIAVELADGSKTTVGTSAPVDSLIPDETAFAVVVTPPRDHYTGPYDIVFEWNDGRGPQREVSGVQVGLPAG
jgi:hypothetical protein